MPTSSLEFDRALTHYGRDSAVGKALGFLYGYDLKGQGPGNHFSARNVEKMRRSSAKRFNSLLGASGTVLLCSKVFEKIQVHGSAH